MSAQTVERARGRLSCLTERFMACVSNSFFFFLFFILSVTDGSTGAYILVVVLLTSLEASIERPDVDDMKNHANIKKHQKHAEQYRQL